MSDRRKTDREDENHSCEREFCSAHPKHDENIDRLFEAQGKRPSWVYYGILVVLLIGSYTYTFYTTDSIVKNQIQVLTTIATDGQRIKNVEDDTADLKRQLKEDLGEIRRILERKK